MGIHLMHTQDKVFHIQDIFDFDEADRTTNDLDKLDNLDRVGEGGHPEEGRPRMYPMFSLLPSLY